LDVGRGTVRPFRRRVEAAADGREMLGDLRARGVRAG